jgi:hypothetical protein
MMREKKSKDKGRRMVMEVLKSAFGDLTAQKSEEEWILTPCTVNGEKSAAIALIKERSDGVDIIPIFVGVTPNMVLLDSTGVPTERQGCEDCLDSDGYNSLKGGGDHRILH